MALEIELNGVRKIVTSTELFQFASRGTIGPRTRLWVDGKETTCDNVKGLTFAAAPANPGHAPTPVYPAPQYAAQGASQYVHGPNVQPTGPNDPLVTKTPFVDYFIGGGGSPYVICYLDAGRSVWSSCGGRVWMKGPIDTETNAQGGLFKSLGRKLFSGETFFMSAYVAKGPSEIAFATKLPGTIVAKQLGQGESLVCQRGAFLAATQGVSLSVFFQKRLGAGFFGGEGFVMQRVTGPGVVFLELDGSSYEYDLAPGERVVCDTGALAWMDATCKIDVEMVSGIKNMIFGGEGIFNTVITGPGKATLQSTSLSQTAGILAPIVANLLPHNN